MPTLEEVLRDLPPVPLNIDIKRHDDHAARAVVELVRRHRAEERVLLASFDAGTLRTVRRLGYEGRTGMGVSEILRLVFLPERALRLRPFKGAAAQVSPRVGPVALDRSAFVARAHGLGLMVDYWTINDPEDAARMLRLGADGIMTDDPARIAPVFARFGAGG